ncbi:MAG: iron-containing alcohol dehydrogenase, partial [Proteobacteria bacterium]|nr:iron-containing alcohol dehydrogenase [Pseudomonadota bacterium]
MQKLFKINSSISNYEITIDSSLSSYLKNLKEEYAILIDENISNKNSETLQKQKNIISIKAIEENKDLKNISNVIHNLKLKSLKKDSILIGIGGGVIQDITCFIASMYMRGINWIYFPTTFLGMCDSCIGGKSS